MPDLDFQAFTREAAAAFKPDYSDVVRRAGRRRTGVAATAALAVAAVAAGGGYAVTRVAGPTPPPATTATASPVPRYTQNGAGAQPGPSYTPLGSDGWDVTEPDTPLTGMYPSMVAGDLDHLYLEYRNCRGSTCTRMVAASGDRGRTWSKHRLPFDAGPFDGGVRAATGRTVIAAVEGRVDGGPVSGSARDWERPPAGRRYFASTDAGATWREVAAREVRSIPSGWPVMAAGTGVAAYDPATGDVAWLSGPTRPDGFTFLLSDVPADAGIWGFGTSHQRPSVPPSPGTAMVGPGPVMPILHVSTDGGATWQERPLPGDLIRTDAGGHSFGSGRIATTDGRTVYAVGGSDRGTLVMHASTDGGQTWTTGARLAADGPLRSVLATRDGHLLLEVGYTAYRSTDGGRTLDRVGPAIGARAHPVDGGYAENTANDSYGIWLSPDGGAWTYVPPPTVP